MRECIYCGRSLQPGEKCSCAMSVAKRMKKEKQKEHEQPPKNRSEIKNEERCRRRAEKADMKERKKQEKKSRHEARRAYSQRGYNSARNKLNKSTFANVGSLIRDFIKSPVKTVMNPRGLGNAETMILVVLEGIISGLCTYSIVTGASRGPFRLLGNLMGFKGVAGYGVLKGWLLSAVSGAIGGVLCFFIFSGIFFLINKFIFKQFTAYRDFARRFAFVAIPSTIIGAIGVLLGFFSQTTFVILLATGAVGSVLVTYEILKSMWYNASSTKLVYTVMAGFFVFAMVIMYIIRLSVM